MARRLRRPVARSGDVPVGGIPDQPDAPVRRNGPRQGFRHSVTLRGIVREDQFPAGMNLRAHRVDRLPQMDGIGIENRNENRKRGRLPDSAEETPHLGLLLRGPSLTGGGIIRVRSSPPESAPIEKKAGKPDDATGCHRLDDRRFPPRSGWDGGRETGLAPLPDPRDPDRAATDPHPQADHIRRPAKDEIKPKSEPGDKDRRPRLSPDNPDSGGRRRFPGGPGER